MTATQNFIAKHTNDRLPAAPALYGVFEMASARIRYERDAEIYGDGEPTEFVYKVISGAVRTVKFTADGRRLVGGFTLPGGIFALEAGAEHQLCAEAIVDTDILVLSRRHLLAMAATDPDLARQLWEVTAKHLARAQEHMLLLGRKTAAEKVASFLVDMAASGVTGSDIDLPMSRYDIADYLGLTIETVSRTLTQLASSRIIERVNSRHISLDLGRLQRLQAQ